jgi:hypothetical protein
VTYGKAAPVLSNDGDSGDVSDDAKTEVDVRPGLLAAVEPTGTETANREHSQGRRCNLSMQEEANLTPGWR